MTTILDAAYFRSLRPAPEPVEQAYPAPEHTSRDPWPADFAAPRPVADLRKTAEAHGWAVRLQYSRGWLPHRTTGKPAVKAHIVTVQAFHPDSRARMLATYVVPVENPAGKKWDSVIITSPKIPPYAGCSITDGKEWLQARGRVLPSWLEEIKWRNRLAEIRDKVWRDYCAGDTFSVIGKRYEVDKQIVMNIVSECKAAGKAAPKRSGKRTEAGG